MNTKYTYKENKKCGSCNKAGSTQCTLNCPIKKESLYKWFKQFGQPDNFKFPKEYTTK